MRYYMFIDESGEANVNKLDERFNIFTLCAVIFNEDEYASFDADLKRLKKKIFNNEDLVFHSYCMRKQRNDFKVFKDERVLTAFYKEIERIFLTYKYTVFACVVDKNRYKLKYPEKNLAYEEAFTFIIERLSYYFAGNRNGNTVHVCLEKRNPDKDRIIKKYYTNIITNGTQYLSKENFSLCHPQLEFRGKNNLVNGLQFADLCAYPIARRALSPNNPQPTFDLFENKIYANMFGDYLGYGLKHFP